MKMQKKNYQQEKVNFDGLPPWMIYFHLTININFHTYIYIYMSTLTFLIMKMILSNSHICYLTFLVYDATVHLSNSQNNEN